MKVFLYKIIAILVLFTGCKTITEERVTYFKHFEGVVEYKCHYLKSTNIKHGRSIEYDRKGNLIGTFNYKNDKLEGEQIFYGDYIDGVVSSIVNFKKDVMDGLAKNFYKDATLKSEVVYKNGLLWNINALYDENGNPLDKGSFKNGNGLVNVYYDNGKIHHSGMYKNGRADGKWLYVTDTGARDTVVYKNGYDDWGIEVIFY